MFSGTSPLDPDLEALRQAALASGAPAMVDLPLDQVRARVRSGDRLCSSGPGPAGSDLTVEADGTAVRVRVYDSTPRPQGTLVYAHGGGWVTGDLAYSDELCRHLAVDAGLRVVSVDYRLAPEHPFPAALDDLAAAYSWARARWTGPLGLGGDSAGGNLAAATVNRLVAEGRPPAAQVLIYPVLGAPGGTASYESAGHAFPIGRADMEWFWRHYTAGGSPGSQVPALIPLRADDLRGTPPTHIVLAGHDPLHDEGMDYARRLLGAGARVSIEDHRDLCHGFLRFTGASEAARFAHITLVRAVRSLWATPERTLASGSIDAYHSTHTGDTTSPEQSPRETR